jgi:putative ABC transport system permease protein
MFLLAGASGLTSFVVDFGALRRLTDERQRLRLDRLR